MKIYTLAAYARHLAEEEGRQPGSITRDPAYRRVRGQHQRGTLPTTTLERALTAAWPAQAQQMSATLSADILETLVVIKEDVG